LIERLMIPGKLAQVERAGTSAESLQTGGAHRQIRQSALQPVAIEIITPTESPCRCQSSSDNRHPRPTRRQVLARSRRRSTPRSPRR
jgi:hypothetical protein